MLARNRGSRLWTVLCLRAVLPWICSCTGSPQTPVRTIQDGIVLTTVALREGVDLLLLMDESGSMYGEEGTDPQQLRYEAAKYLGQNLLVKEADAALPHRISIIQFGDVAISRTLVEPHPGQRERAR